MENQAKEFGLFIDGLRLERNISREDLIEGIMSLSQYKRYLRGDTSIPNGKLVMLADRLKFSLNEIFYLFRTLHNNQYNQILQVFQLLKKFKFNDAYDYAMAIRKETFVSDYNKLFYDYCMINIQYNKKLISDVHVLGKLSELINYPECLDNDSFNMVEMNALINIIEISANMGNYEPANLSYQILTSKTHQMGMSDYTVLPSLFSSLALILGKQGKHQNVIEISNRGIEYCLYHETLNGLAHLYFYNAVANLRLDNKDEALTSAKKCFMQLFIEDHDNKITTFKTSFERIFEMQLDDLIKV